MATTDQLTAATAARRPGDKVAVDWTDTAGRQHHATVTLAAGPAN